MPIRTYRGLKNFQRLCFKDTGKKCLLKRSTDYAA